MLGKLAKERLRKVADEGMVSGTQLSPTVRTQRFFNQVQAAQTSSANTGPFRPSQSYPAQGTNTARAMFLVLIPSVRLAIYLFCKIVKGS